MPYTPPARSPASTSPNSPTLSRNQSYEASPKQSDRPGLPRSRSATYLQKHRRTPSISDHQTPSHHVTNSMNADPGHGDEVQSPVSYLAVPSSDSSAMSPSESPQGSDDEDRSRGRQLRVLAESLKDTMIVSKSHSPTRKEEDLQPAAPKSTPANGTASPALTPEARKISHSRSSSEIQLSKLADVPAQATSSDESDDEEDLMMKPPLLRKKSGELVKPALRASRASSRRRPSSMPGTPTFSKAVHFNEDIEQVRHFLQVDRPIAVSAGSSPVETYDSEGEYPFEGHKANVVEWEIRTANFPRETPERQWQAVRVEKVFLSSDMKNLVGVVACQNWGFQKYVVARFTLDYWKTTSEVVCEYNNDVRRKQTNDGCDRFNFNIKLSDQAHLESKTMLLCVRYNVNGQDHWDSNNNMNYQVDFIKKKSTPRPARQGSGAGTLGTIPRSRHSPTTNLTRPRSFPAAHDDDFGSNFEFGASTTILRDPQPASYRSRNRKGSILPPQIRKTQQSGAFATRYDFGASLSAALSNAQVQQLDGKTAEKSATGGNADYFSGPATRKQAAPAVQPVGGPGPAKPVTSGRPELGSQEYHDLIQKFCYFGSKQGSPGAMSPDPNGPTSVPNVVANLMKRADPQVDGPTTMNSGSDESANSSPRSSASSSPPSPRLEKHQYDGGGDSHRTSRSSTPSSFHSASPRLLAQYRSPSPALHEQLPFQVLAQ